MAKVVLVEDDVLLAKMYQRLLNFSGHDVVLATDGEKAVDMVVQEKPDIVLMDIMMPRMNGLQALEQIRTNEQFKQTPIIVMSGLANVNSEEEVLAKGATKYIDKGQYDPKALADLVNQVLGVSANQPEAPTPTQTDSSNQSA